MTKPILLLLSMLAIAGSYAQTPLNGVTFGFGAGYSYSFDRLYDYSLTTDANHYLKRQPLSKGNFVISSVVSIKVKPLGVDKNNRLSLFDTKAKTFSAPTKKLIDRASINLALNLINLNANDLSFNKSIDGGLGAGFFINEFVQVAAFFDVSKVRQLRSHVTDSYLDKSIPTGKDGEVYNALDINDDQLFYNKTVSGVSVKVIFSLANKKAEP